MPARAKVTKEMIVDAAFAIAREAGSGTHQRKDCIGKAALLHTARHVSFCDDGSTEKNRLCEGRPLSFGIPDDHEETAQGRCPWNRNELYPLCHRRTPLVPFPFSVGLFQRKDFA